MQDIRALGDGRASDYQGEAVFARGLVLFKVLTIGVVATTGILPWGPLSPCLSGAAPGGVSTDVDTLPYRLSQPVLLLVLSGDG